MYTSKSNAQFDELCKLTTTLVPKYGSRPAAFKEACRQRPDLAAAAIRPTGERVVPIATKKPATAPRPPEDPLSKAVAARTKGTK